MDKTEASIKLAELFQGRLKSLQDLQWRANLSTWGVFAGAAGIAISIPTWHPDWLAFGWCVGIVLLYLAGYCVWLNFLNRRYTYFESQMDRCGEEAATSAGITPPPGTPQESCLPIWLFRGWKPPTWVWKPPVIAQLGVTFLVTGLFVLAMGHKAYTSPTTNSHAGKITIEGFESTTMDQVQVKAD